MRHLLYLVIFSLMAEVGFASPVRVGLVFDKGGKDDRSFNSAAHRGALKAKDDFGVSVKYVEATDDNAFETLLRAFAQKDFDLIVSVGFAQADAVRKVAAQFPQKQFAIVDAEVKAGNVQSLLFEEHEGSFLVGAIAALTSKTGKIGFIGGMDIPLIRRFQLGYEAGAKKIKPSIRISSNFIGVTGEAWNNPAKAKELALVQYGSGIDVIFAAAGASNGGLFDAAEEKKKLAIGVDSNQNFIKPGFILTSMLKRVDNAVYRVIEEVTQKRFQPGVKHFGLSNQGIDFAVDEHNQKLLSKELLAQIEKLRADILAKKIKVPDYYQLRK